MPDEAWGIISSSYIIAYQRVDDGSLKYLGMDDLGATDDAGHPLVAMDGTWVHVAGRPCCYQAKGSRLTEEGTIFTGTTKALVNGVESTIYIEWDPITEESGDAVEGHVTGYNETQLDDVLSFVGGISPELTSLLTDGKAMRQLQPGDRVEFLFDYYDDAASLCVETSRMSPSPFPARSGLWSPTSSCRPETWSLEAYTPTSTSAPCRPRRSRQPSNNATTRPDAPHEWGARSQ